MKKIFLICLLFLMGCSAPAVSNQISTVKSESAQIQSTENSEVNPMSDNMITLTVNGEEIIFELNDSNAAAMLKEQFPADVTIENYSNNEKTFYPSIKLNTDNAPLADGTAGELAYFEPWGDVVMYYGEAGPYSGLYSLGKCVKGQELISSIPEGEVHIQ